MSMLVDLHALLQPLLDHAPLRSVDRAIADLRRGEMVLVDAGDADAVLALAVEAVSAPALALMQALTHTPPRLAITRRRAQVLGLLELAAADAETGMVLLTPITDNAGNTGDVIAHALDAETICQLTDPTVGGPVPALTITTLVAESAASGAGALAKLARLLPAVVLARLSVPDSEDAPDWGVLAERHDLMRVRATDIADYSVHATRTLRRVAEAEVPLAEAERARLIAFRPANGAAEHLAIVIGAPDSEQPVLVRLHSECFTGDLLGSLRCDCGDQLRGAIAEIARHGSGVLLYLAQEGRGIGLVNKLRAYRLQDQGHDTVDANEMLGFEADERLYLPAAEMLRQLTVTRVRLMTNNPDKLRQLAQCGIEVVERVAHIFPSNGHNEAYLRTKAERSGHLF